MEGFTHFYLMSNQIMESQLIQVSCLTAFDKQSLMLNFYFYFFFNSAVRLFCKKQTAGLTVIKFGAGRKFYHISTTL